MPSGRSLSVYCSADANYVPTSIVALSSFRRFHPDCGYFLVTNAKRLSPEMRALALEFAIELVDVDLADVYAADPPGAWPSEAFWQLYGPKAFAELGYRHSLLVDGDVLCVRPLPLETLLPRVHGYAGIDNGPSRWQLRDEGALRREFGITPGQLERPATNSGVVIYNNEFMSARRLFEESARLWRAGKDWAFRHRGDQPLLALTGLVLELPMYVLGQEYNCRFDLHPSGANARLLREMAQDPSFERTVVYIVHYLGGKPWTAYPDLRGMRRVLKSLRPGSPYVDGWNSSTPARVHWVNQWRRYAKELFGADRVRRYFGAESLRTVKPTLLGNGWLSMWDSYLWLRMVYCKLHGAPWG